MKVRVYPNFLLVGAARSGTTSLYEYLIQHPDIFMAEVKEPHYFVHEYGMRDIDRYLDLFGAASDQKRIGEASSLYLYCEESPGWIKSVLGNVKIIIILREPAQRAFSLYNWMIREGYEDATTFEDALAREPKRLCSTIFRETCPHFFLDYLYYTTGLYFEQVRRYFDTFERENIFVGLFEDFVRNPHAFCMNVFEFLGVDSQFEPSIIPHNRGVKPRSIRLQYWLRTRASKPAVFRSSSFSFRRRMHDKLMQLNVQLGSRPRPNPTTLKALRGRYRTDIFNVMELLDRDLSHWVEND